MGSFLAAGRAASALRMAVRCAPADSLVPVIPKLRQSHPPGTPNSTEKSTLIDSGRGLGGLLHPISSRRRASSQKWRATCCA